MSMSMSMSMSMGAGQIAPLQLGGAVPPELDAHPITLDFSPDPQHPTFPRDLLPQERWKFDPRLWDAKLLSTLALHEFAKLQWDALQIDPKYLGWCSDDDTALAFVKEEIEVLRSLMENDRERYMPEILAQHDNAPFYWISMLGLTNVSRPKTILLLQIAVRIGEMAAIHFKDVYRRVRPSVVCPGLSPPFGPPGHPAFPSGHALQGRLLTRCLIEATRPQVPQNSDLPWSGSPYETQLAWLSDRVAVNRERAGLHYPSDSGAGQYIADALFDDYLYETPQCRKPLAPIFNQAIRDARDEWSAIG